MNQTTSPLKPSFLDAIKSAAENKELDKPLWATGSITWEKFSERVTNCSVDNVAEEIFAEAQRCIAAINLFLDKPVKSEEIEFRLAPSHQNSTQAVVVFAAPVYGRDVFVTIGLALNENGHITGTFHSYMSIRPVK